MNPGSSKPVITYIPCKGDIAWIHFDDPSVGAEQRGHRLAIVISPKSYNKVTKLAVVCPITSHKKGYPFEVVLPNTMKSQGVILSDHVKSVDWQEREAEFYEKALPEVLKEVLEKLDALLYQG